MIFRRRPFQPNDSNRKTFRFLLKTFGQKILSRFLPKPSIPIQQEAEGKLEFYLNFKNMIPGWCDYFSIQLLIKLDQLQKQHKIQGDVFEIGVFHGMSAVLFTILNENTDAELNFCDLFEGERLDNFLLYKNHLASEERDIKILKKSSHDLQDSDVSKNNKLIHIDGGHDYKDIYNDMEFCFNRLAPKGVLVIDDYLHFALPDVTFGLNDFLSSHKTISPFLFAFGKAYCCRAEDKEWFDLEIKNILDSEDYKIHKLRPSALKLHGQDILVVKK